MKRRTKKKLTFPSCLDLSGVCEREIEIERERERTRLIFAKKKKKSLRCDDQSAAGVSDSGLI